MSRVPFSFFSNLCYPLPLLHVSRWRIWQERAISHCAYDIPGPLGILKWIFAANKNTLFKMNLVLKFLSHKVRGDFRPAILNPGCLLLKLPGELKKIFDGQTAPRSNKSDTWGRMQASEFFQVPQTILTCSQVYNHCFGLALEPTLESPGVC